MITVRQRGNFDKTEKFLKKSFGRHWVDILEKYAQEGVKALSAATPVDSGETAISWGYELIQNKDSFSIVWTNNHVNKGVNIAVILQYGHATKGGGYVQGRDYINPALRPIFDKMADAAWKEVSGT